MLENSVFNKMTIVRTYGDGPGCGGGGGRRTWPWAELARGGLVSRAGGSFLLNIYYLGLIIQSTEINYKTKFKKFVKLFRKTSVE